MLVCGAAGFLGRAICGRLRSDGFSVLRGVRVPRRPDERAIDYRRANTVADWLPLLAGVDAVVNAVGILVERAAGDFERIHHRAPAALFAACARAGVRRVVQVSALGAERGESGYFRSKRAADQSLRGLPLDWQVLRPALVYGPHGRSAGWFRMLASLPLLPLPGRGTQRLQPVHVDDLAEAVARLLAGRLPACRCWTLAGPEVLSWRGMLGAYRRALGLPPAPALRVPGMALLARLAGLWPGSPLNPETWRMLQAGSCAPVADSVRLLGRRPRPIDEFIAPGEAAGLRERALAGWRGPLLRGVLALIWLASGALGLGIHPRQDSLALLGELGLAGLPAAIVLYGAALLDIGLGLASLLRPGRRLWWLQLGLVLGYSLIIALGLPRFLHDPFGPVLKNLAVAALLVVLLSEERRR